MEWLHCVGGGFSGEDSGRRWSGYIVWVMVSVEETLGGGVVVTLCGWWFQRRRLWEEVEWLHCVGDGFSGEDSGRRCSGYIVWVMVSAEKTLGGGGVQAAAGPVVDEGGGHKGGTRRVS